MWFCCRITQWYHGCNFAGFCGRVICTSGKTRCDCPPAGDDYRRDIDRILRGFFKEGQAGNIERMIWKEAIYLKNPEFYTIPEEI